jgi:putative ABC transport system substrate-binding protein
VQLAESSKQKNQEIPVRNKVFRFALCFMLLAASFPAAAQQPQRIPQIGWIALYGSRPSRDFMNGLRERGYVEGQSIIVEYRSAQGDEERLSKIAAELVRLKPDVIVTASNATTDAAKQATSTIPIVFMHGDPISTGVVDELAHPRSNLTGLNVLSFELAGKRLELLRDAFPKLRRVAVLLNAGAPVHRRQRADMGKVAQTLDVQLQSLELRDSKLDFESISNGQSASVPKYFSCFPVQKSLSTQGGL